MHATTSVSFTLSAAPLDSRVGRPPNCEFTVSSWRYVITGARINVFHFAVFLKFLRPFPVCSCWLGCLCTRCHSQCDTDEEEAARDLQNFLSTWSSVLWCSYCVKSNSGPARRSYSLSNVEYIVTRDPWSLPTVARRIAVVIHGMHAAGGPREGAGRLGKQSESKRYTTTPASSIALSGLGSTRERSDTDLAGRYAVDR